jgi:hypothetical protein
MANNTSSAENDTDLEGAVRQKFSSERTNLERLEATGLTGVVRARAQLIRTITQGASGRRQRRKLKSKDQIFLREFLDFGAKAILSTGAQRGGDFLNNQLRGRWAEQVVLSMALPNFKFLAFGPSGAAMPGHENHRRVVTTYAEIEKLEGKRPDLIAFDNAVWESLGAEARARAISWPDRLLEDEDREVVRQSRFGIEVKNSTWHFARRRERHVILDDDADVGRLSITVKDEELDKIVGWMEKTGKPVLFFQVLFDEIYCMSFSRMVDAIREGRVYAERDYLRDGATGAGGKLYHRFFLSDTRHRCALVHFPGDSIAHVEVLASGSVIPYVELRPSQAHSEQPSIIEAEVAVAENALRRGLPVIMRPTPG